MNTNLDRIKVAVKVRPLIGREIAEKLTEKWATTDSTIFQIDAHGKPKGDTFSFDHVFGVDKSTTDMFEIVAKPIVLAAVKGFHGTIFAYGQTSSGKTYTMKGCEESPGIIPLSVSYMFEAMQKASERVFLVRASYVEIYNEKIHDLLQKGATNPKIREEDGQVFIADLKEEVTSTPEKILDMMQRGEKYRRVGETNMNERSSRSHTIFRIVIESRLTGEGDGAIQVSQLNLVDLAGSERANQSGTVGERLKEGCAINRSLSTLGLVIRQLSDAEEFVCYRNSKLTRILQSSLGGNALTAIICTVTPTSIEETSCTLWFAMQAKKIKNKPKLNEVLSDAVLLKRYTRQIQTLQEELAKTRMKENSSEMMEKLEEERKHNELLEERINRLQEKLISGATKESNRSPQLCSRAQRRKTWCAPAGFYRSKSIGGTPALVSYLSLEEGTCSPSHNDYVFDTPLEEFELQLIQEEEEGAEFEELEVPQTVTRRCKRVTFNEVSTAFTAEPCVEPDALVSTPVEVLRSRLRSCQSEVEQLASFSILERKVNESEEMQRLKEQNHNLEQSVTDAEREARVARRELAELQQKYQDLLTERNLSVDDSSWTSEKSVLLKTLGEKTQQIKLLEAQLADHDTELLLLKNRHMYREKDLECSLQEAWAKIETFKQNVTIEKPDPEIDRLKGVIEKTSSECAVYKDILTKLGRKWRCAEMERLDETEDFTELERAYLEDMGIHDMCVKMDRIVADLKSLHENCSLKNLARKCLSHDLSNSTQNSSQDVGNFVFHGEESARAVLDNSEMLQQEKNLISNCDFYIQKDICCDNKFELPNQVELGKYAQKTTDSKHQVMQNTGGNFVCTEEIDTGKNINRLVEADHKQQSDLLEEESVHSKRSGDISFKAEILDFGTSGKFRDMGEVVCASQIDHVSLNEENRKDTYRITSDLNVPDADKTGVLKDFTSSFSFIKDELKVTFPLEEESSCISVHGVDVSHEFERLKQELQHLKEENEQLKKQEEQCQQTNSNTTDEVKKLFSDIIHLKQENEILRKKYVALSDERSVMMKEILQLKQQSTDLKALKFVGQYNSPTQVCNLDILNTCDEVQRLTEEIINLKKWNEELQKQVNYQVENCSTSIQANITASASEFPKQGETFNEHEDVKLCENDTSEELITMDLPAIATLTEMVKETLFLKQWRESLQPQTGFGAEHSNISTQVDNLDTDTDHILRLMEEIAHLKKQNEDLKQHFSCKMETYNTSSQTGSVGTPDKIDESMEEIFYPHQSEQLHQPPSCKADNMNKSLQAVNGGVFATSAELSKLLEEISYLKQQNASLHRRINHKSENCNVSVQVDDISINIPEEPSSLLVEKNQHRKLNNKFQERVKNVAEKCSISVQVDEQVITDKPNTLMEEVLHLKQQNAELLQQVSNRAEKSSLSIEDSPENLHQLNVTAHLEKQTETFHEQTKKVSVSIQVDNLFSTPERAHTRETPNSEPRNKDLHPQERCDQHTLVETEKQKSHSVLEDKELNKKAQFFKTDTECFPCATKLEDEQVSCDLINKHLLGMENYSSNYDGSSTQLTLSDSALHDTDDLSLVSNTIDDFNHSLQNNGKIRKELKLGFQELQTTSDALETTRNEDILHLKLVVEQLTLENGELSRCLSEEQARVHDITRLFWDDFQNLLEKGDSEQNSSRSKNNGNTSGSPNVIKGSVGTENFADSTVMVKLETDFKGDDSYFNNTSWSVLPPDSLVESCGEASEVPFTDEQKVKQLMNENLQLSQKCEQLQNVVGMLQHSLSKSQVCPELEEVTSLREINNKLTNTITEKSNHLLSCEQQVDKLLVQIGVLEEAQENLVKILRDKENIINAAVNEAEVTRNEMNVMRATLDQSLTDVKSYQSSIVLEIEGLCHDWQHEELESLTPQKLVQAFLTTVMKKQKEIIRAVQQSLEEISAGTERQLAAAEEVNKKQGALICKLEAEVTTLRQGLVSNCKGESCSVCFDEQNALKDEKNFLNKKNCEQEHIINQLECKLCDAESANKRLELDINDFSQKLERSRKEYHQIKEELNSAVKNDKAFKIVQLQVENLLIEKSLLEAKVKELLAEKQKILDEVVLTKGKVDDCPSDEAFVTLRRCDAYETTIVQVETKISDTQSKNEQVKLDLSIVDAKNLLECKSDHVLQSAEADITSESIQLESEELTKAGSLPDIRVKDFLTENQIATHELLVTKDKVDGLVNHGPGVSYIALRSISLNEEAKVEEVQQTNSNFKNQDVATNTHLSCLQESLVQVSCESNDEVNKTTTQQLETPLQETEYKLEIALREKEEQLEIALREKEQLEFELQEKQEQLVKAKDQADMSCKIQSSYETHITETHHLRWLLVNREINNKNLNFRNQELLEKISSLKDDLKEKSKVNDILELHLKNCYDKNQTLLADIEEKQSKLQQVETQIEKFSDQQLEIQNLRKNLELNKNKVKQLSEEVNQYKAELKIFYAKVNDQETVILKCTDENCKLTLQLAEMQKHLREAELQHNQMVKADNFNELVLENKDLKTELKSSELKVKELWDKYCETQGDLERKIKEINILETDFRSLQATNTKFIEEHEKSKLLKIEELERQRTSCQVHLTEIQELRRHADISEARQQELQSNVEALRCELADMQNIALIQESHIQKFNDEKEALKSELEELSKAKQYAETLKNSYFCDSNSKKSSAKDQKAQNNSLVTELLECKGKLEAANQRSLTSDEQTRMLRHIAQLQHENSGLKMKVKELNSEMEVTLKNFDDKNQRWKEEVRRVTKRVKELEPFKDEVEELRMQLAKQVRDIKVLRLHHRRASNDKVSVGTTTDPSAVCHCNELREQLKNLRVDLANSQARAASLQLKMEAENLPHKNRAKELQDMMMVYKNRNKDLKSQVQHLNLELAKQAQSECQNCCSRRLQQVDCAVQVLMPGSESLELVGSVSGVVQSSNYDHMKDRVKRLERENALLKQLCKTRTKKLEELQKSKLTPDPGCPEQENVVLMASTTKVSPRKALNKPLAENLR